MKDIELTDADKKWLTGKLLGECWHEWVWEDVDPHGRFKYHQGGWYCKKCDKESCRAVNFRMQAGRTFTAPADQHAVVKAIHGAGKWNDFYAYGTSVWMRTTDTANSVAGDYTAWLFFLPPRIPWLAVQARDAGIFKEDYENLIN